MRRISFMKSRQPGGLQIDELEDCPHIAVHLHLFYTELLDEFLNYFQNIPCPFDLYISCMKGADKEEIQRKAKASLEQLNRIEIRFCKNRGRDIAPFYVTFGRELMHYPYLLHVHSKKSRHIEKGGADWRIFSLQNLLGSREHVEEILRRFAEEPDVGLVYPDWHPDIPMIGYTWMANGAQGRKLLMQMGIPCEDGIFFYPTGSFFWARTDAILPLFQKNFSLRDFPREKGQIDGTLAHVLERAISFVVKSRGYHSYIVDAAEHEMKKDRTLKPFKSYMDMTKEDAFRKLREYASVSFGVFGTLIEVLAYQRDDIVRMAVQRMGLPESAVQQRKDAERRAGEKYGSAVNIHHIYDMWHTMSDYDRQHLEKMKQTELECLSELVQPRKDMPEIVRRLLEAGVRVSIVCDACYPSEMIASLLDKCGYKEYDKLWVSCEHGVSKHDEQMWNLVYGQYDPRHHIHVGSDVYADWYTLERRGTASLYVMSARQAYELSDIYEEPRHDMKLQDSLALGRRVKQELFPSPFGLSGQKGMC